MSGQANSAPSQPPLSALKSRFCQAGSDVLTSRSRPGLDSHCTGRHLQVRLASGPSQASLTQAVLSEIDGCKVNVNRQGHSQAAQCISRDGFWQRRLAKSGR